MNRFGRYQSAGLIPFAALLLIGCGSTQTAAPRELVDARAAYNRAASGPAAQFDPADLHVAKSSLDRAEQWFAQDSTAPETRTQAYLAQRRAQTAESNGQISLANAQRAQAESTLVKAQALALADARSELDRTKAQLAESQKNGSAADQRAMALLERQGQVKNEARGKVITLPGSLLFQTGKSELSAAARARLDTVAQALKEAPDKGMVIEGYTDSTGTDAVNEPLSQARADAVRNYLESRGVPAANLTSKGFGSARPIANNASVEGRATNRRVEIVIPTGSAMPMPADKNDDKSDEKMSPPQKPMQKR